MAEKVDHALSNIPLPTVREHNRHPGLSPFSGGLPDIKKLLHSIQLDDILLFGLIILIATDDDCDNFLLVLLIFIFIAGFDKTLFPFLL